MTSPDTLAYVKAASQMLGLKLDEARALRVVEHFERTQALAATLENVPLAPEDEITEIYRPAPFPDEEGA